MNITIAKAIKQIPIMTYTVPAVSTAAFAASLKGSTPLPLLLPAGDKEMVVLVFGDEIALKEEPTVSEKSEPKTVTPPQIMNPAPQIIIIAPVAISTKNSMI